MGFDAIGAYRNVALTAGASKVSVASVSKGATQPLSDVKPKTAYQELDDYVKMTPAQRMRADLLKKLGKTEEEVANMSPEERQGFEAKMRDMIQQQLQEAQKKQLAPRQVGQWIDTTA